ncbi:MAG: ABC transporter permease, partial [candidate division Zixibacteria bacterium]|nr:ABC transporter permease [candidate division Zixibacteria bacterium]
MNADKKSSSQNKTRAQITESVFLALNSLKTNKFRSAMTIVGVMIGVCSVIFINTILDGFTAYAEASIDKIGTNLIYIRKWEPHTDFDNMTDAQRRRRNITTEEAIEIRESCDLIVSVSPQKRSFGNVIKYGSKRATNPDDYRGVWPEYATVTNRGVELGRFIDEGDMKRKGMVCVIGPEVADALFEVREEALGKIIRVNGRKFEVIGIHTEIDDWLGISENDFVLIPLTTFDKIYPEIRRVTILCSAVSKDKIDEAIDQVVGALRRSRGVRPEEENNFGILTQDRFKNRISSITMNIQLVAVAVASVGLFVGLVGVMNIMLVSVTERTREIGVRKAIGAKRSNILFQFLTEAATLTALGGVTGIIVGALGGLVLTTILDWE